MRKHIVFLLFGIFFFTELSFAQFNKRPIARFSLDAHADDISGNNNNGRIINNVTPCEDRFGNQCGAMEFDGSGYIEVPNSSSLNRISNEFTVTGWINYSPYCNNSLWWGTIICKGDDRRETDYNPQYRLQFTNVTFSLKSNMVGSRGVVPWNMKYAFSENKWHFFASTYDGSVVKFYLDGDEVFRYAIDLDFSANSSPLHIGRDMPGDDEFLCGKLDDIRIYNQELSQREVRNIFKDNTRANPCPGTSTPQPTPQPQPQAQPRPTPQSTTPAANIPPTTTPSTQPSTPAVVPQDECEFPESLANNRINYAYVEYKTKREKMMVFAFDKDGPKNSIMVNINGTWLPDAINLTEDRVYILEHFLDKKCNYILFKSVNGPAVFNIDVDRKSFGDITCKENEYYGIKIIYEE